MSGSGLETVPEVREWSGGSPEGPGVVWRLSRSSGIDQVGSPEGPGVLRRPSRRSGSGREALPGVRE